MKTTTKRMRKPAQIEILAVESQYRDGAWSEVRARITWSFHGTPVSILEERSALATAHRLVAELLEATPPSEKWNASAEIAGSYRDVTVALVKIELAEGDAREVAAAKALLAATVGA